MKHLFIVNPAARQGNRVTFVTSLIQQAFAYRSEPYEVYVTQAPMDACRKIQKDAATESDLRVYACGGDGTINECASACAGLENVCMTCFPCGTGNDFVKLFGDEKDRFLNMTALIDGEVSPLDIIRINDRYSLNIACIGVDGRVGTGVHEFDNVPIIGRGKGAYMLSAVVNFCRQITDDLTITVNGQTFSGPVNCLCVCNGTWYGGSFNPVPEARANDGILDVLLIRGLSRLQFPRLFLQYGRGEYARLSKYITHLQTDRLVIDARQEFLINLDGEAMTTTHAEMQLLPGGLRFLHPKGMKYFQTESSRSTVEIG